MLLCFIKESVKTMKKICKVITIFIAAVAGVNGLVAKLIAGTCVAACTAAPIGGVVCAACIGGVCAIGAADIAAIVSCFKL